MMKISRELLPIKAHFFFFFAAVGPLLPQMNVFGKQLGASPVVMGAVTAILPVLWAMAKPIAGFLADYFQSTRKLIFTSFIVGMSASFCGLYFLPGRPPESAHHQVLTFSAVPRHKYTITPTNDLPCDDKINTTACESLASFHYMNASCNWVCDHNDTQYTTQIDQKLVFKTQDLYTNDKKQHRLNDILYSNLNATCNDLKMDLFENRTSDDSSKQKASNHLEFESASKSPDRLKRILDKAACSVKMDCLNLKCVFSDLQEENKLQTANNNSLSKENVSKEDTEELLEKIDAVSEEKYNLYASVTFWGFVVLMCLGTVFYNVANCLGDAVCFDVLGPSRGLKYGWQRAWGTAGYGLTALLSGWLVDKASGANSHKDFTPAFILTAVFTLIDLYFCRKLKLPSMPHPPELGAALGRLLRERAVVIFLLCAVLVGVFDSFVIYYLFWFMEELAEQRQEMVHIKLLEGLTVAAECLGGELLFFAISGKIIKRLGFVKTLSLCLCCYAVRFLMISLITAPWQVLPIELVMQGPTYALCYSAIVGYAAQLAPAGLSATLQGLVAGVDDGLGFALGGLLGGVLYGIIGGRLSFQLLAALAAITALAHMLLAASDTKPANTELLNVVIAEPSNDVASKNIKKEECPKTREPLILP